MTDEAIGPYYFISIFEHSEITRVRNASTSSSCHGFFTFGDFTGAFLPHTHFITIFFAGGIFGVSRACIEDWFWVFFGLIEVSQTSVTIGCSKFPSRGEVVEPMLFTSNIFGHDLVSWTLWVLTEVAVSIGVLTNVLTTSFFFIVTFLSILTNSINAAVIFWRVVFIWESFFIKQASMCDPSTAFSLLCKNSWKIFAAFASCKLIFACSYS